MWGPCNTWFDARNRSALPHCAALELQFLTRWKTSNLWSLPYRGQKFYVAARLTRLQKSCRSAPWPAPSHKEPHRQASLPIVGISYFIIPSFVGQRQSGLSPSTSTKGEEGNSEMYNISTVYKCCFNDMIYRLKFMSLSGCFNQKNEFVKWQNELQIKAREFISLSRSFHSIIHHASVGNFFPTAQRKALRSAHTIRGWQLLNMELH